MNTQTQSSPLEVTGKPYTLPTIAELIDICTISPDAQTRNRAARALYYKGAADGLDGIAAGQKL